MTVASRWILRTRPLNTVPGPTSTYVVTPSDARRWTTASQRTGDDTCATSASIAGDDHLAGAVDIRRAHHPALRSLRTCLRDLVGVEPQNRRHRARTHRHRFLHVPSAPADRAKRVGQRKRSGSDVSRVLAEAVPGDERGRYTARHEQPRGGDADGEDRRLRV